MNSTLLPNSSFKKTGITLDVLLILILVPAHIIGRDAYLSVVALLAYLLLSLWYPLSSDMVNTVNNKRAQVTFLIRFGIIIIIAFGAVVVPTLSNIINRSLTPIEADGFSAANVTLSDSAMQTELALAYLSGGQNPYEERYEDTPLRFYRWLDDDLPGWRDPAYDYFVYLPANLFLSYPFYQAAAQLGLLYDQRIVFLLLYIILLLILPQLTASPINKLALIIGVGLNPLFTNSVILGMNDVAVFVALVLMILMLNRGHFFGAVLFLGIACALKQYAWFVVPFFLLYLWQVTPSEKRLRQIIFSVGLIGSIVLLTISPFLIWNPQAFYADTFAYPAGRSEFLYPIRGFTVGRIFMGMGIIQTFVDPFPFQLLQALFGIPLLLLLLRYQYRRNLAAMILATAVFIFGIGYFSRFFHENYVGVVIALATLGILLDFQTTPDRPVIHEE